MTASRGGERSLFDDATSMGRPLSTSIGLMGCLSMQTNSELNVRTRASEASLLPVRLSALSAPPGENA